MNVICLSPRDAVRRAREKSARTVTVDIGNTAYKFGLFNSPRLDAVRQCGLPSAYPFSIDDLRILPSQLKVLPVWLSIFAPRERGSDRPLLWLMSSVNQQRTELFLEFISQKRPGDIFALLSSADIPVKTSYTVPAQLGIDRKLAALAARRRFARPTAVFIADIGTAVKFDLVDKNGLFLGGAIFPGPETGIRSLHKETDQLPELSWSVRKIPGSYPAVNTNDAIRLGMAGVLAGSLCFFYKKALVLTDQSFLPIIITGGGAIGLEPFLRTALSDLLPDIPNVWIRTVRDLIHSGIELTRQSFASDQ